MKRYQIYLTCLLILVPAIIVLLYHYIGSSGHILFHDVTEGINSDNIFSRYFFGYNDNLGSTLVELSRIPIFSIIWIIFKSLFYYLIG